MSTSVGTPSISTSPLPRWVWWVSIPLVAVVVGFGVWVTGALITDDEKAAKGITTVWFLVAGLVVVTVAWKWRALALPVIGTYLVVTGVVGGFLLYASTVDQVVDEQVVTADTGDLNSARSRGSEPDGQSSGQTDSGNIEVASGTFAAGAHPTQGTARIIETSGEQHVLTLTGFATDPGPDLRVYVVPSGAQGIDGGLDLGALKGNEGNQQYNLPDGTKTGTVVIWCRAFSVTFGSARLS